MLKEEVVNKNFELKRKILQIVFIYPNYDDIMCVEISGSPLPHFPLLSKILQVWHFPGRVILWS